jgi:hypothetical protein
MTDIATVRHIGVVVLVISALATTLFPVLYAKAPWYRSALGRAVMFRAVALALVLDLAVVFELWVEPRSRLVLLWINIAVLAVIGASSAAMSVVLMRIRRYGDKRSHDAGEHHI